MKYEYLIPIAKRKLVQAEKAYEQGIKRKGVTEEEIKKLLDNLTYARTSLYLIEIEAEYEEKE